MGIVINGVDIGTLPATNTATNTKSNYTLIQLLQGAISTSDAFLTVVNTKEDLPEEVANVITLVDGMTYVVTNNIDLLGCRIVCGTTNVITGYSSENCSITSTGLGVGVPLITCDNTIVLKYITFKDVDTCLDIDGFGNTCALDWEALNFENIPSIGVVKNFENFIYINGAILNSNGFIFDGTMSTVGVSGCLFVGDGSANNIISVNDTAIVSRRIRFIYSSFVAFGSTTAIYVDPSATIPSESYILDTINFSGGGTYVSGIINTSDKALFTNCFPIANTASVGQVYINDNITPTTISLIDTFYKAAGTYTLGPNNSKFTATDNRLTCDATISRRYLIQATISFNSGNGNICEFGIYLSSEAGICLPSVTKATGNASGRAESVSILCISTMSNLDYAEVHCANTTGANDITLTDVHFMVTEIK